MGQMCPRNMHGAGDNMDLRLLPFRFPGIAGVGCAFQMALPARPGLLRRSAAIFLWRPVRAAQMMRRSASSPTARRCGTCWGCAVWPRSGRCMAWSRCLSRKNRNFAAPPDMKPDGLAASRAPERELTGLMIKTADCQPYLWRTGTAAISWPCIRAGGGAAGAIPGLPVEEFCEHYRLPGSRTFRRARAEPRAGPRGVHAVRGRMGRGVHGVF